MIVSIIVQVMITVIIVDMGVKEIVKVLKGSGEYMTENKRFTLINWDNYAEGGCIYYDNGEEMGSLDVLNTLNGLDGTIKDLSDDYQRLMEENKELKSRLEIYNEYLEDLEERNDRQAKQLDNIYNLIEKQDWKQLQGIIQEFQECEEQLQREYRCYDDN